MARAALPDMARRALLPTLALFAMALGVRARFDELHARPALCTLRALSMRLRVSEHVAFIGTADADTVRAEPGPMRYVEEPGHYGRGTPRTIYGQVARVQRLEDAAPRELRDAIADNPRVVLVPWDYSASCDPVIWSRSAQWLNPGTRGVFVGTLRPRAHWVGDRPTFDVTPEVAIYPSQGLGPRRMRWSDDQLLSADEFFALYQVLPNGRALRTAPDSVIAPLLRWAQAFPNLAAKQPAAYFLDYVRREVEEERYKNRGSMLAGTYRVVYRTPAGDSSVFFARTESRPNSAIRPKDPDGWGTAIIGHYLRTVVARTERELPSQRTGVGELEGYFAFLDSATATTADSNVYSGSIDLQRAAAALAPDSTSRRGLAEAGRQKEAALSEMFRRGEPGTPGRFIITPTGRVRFEMTIARDGSPVLTVHAERISREHLRVRSP